MTNVYCGIDLGGTSIKAALATGTGEILVSRSAPTDSHRGPQAVIETIEDLVSEMLAATPDVRLLGCGVGVPGLVDVITGTTKFLPNMPTQWRDIPLAQLLGERLGCPLKVLNDVRTATLGELRFGHGKRNPRMSLAFFAIGTGIGGGIAIDGQLRLGPLGAAGELGHLTMISDGPGCGCGNRGCLEALASGPAIAAEGVRLLRMGLAPALFELTEGHSDRVTTVEMRAAADRDQSVRDAIVRAATWIGIAAANVVATIHPDLVVLGGGVAEMGDLLIDTVRQTIIERVRMFPPDTIHVERSLLHAQAGLMGALALAMDAAAT